MTKPYSDPYITLELARSASDSEIKRAYFTQVRAHPPEREPEVFKRIRAAYERLRDPEKRAETELTLLQPWPESSRRRRPLKLDADVHREDIIAAARALTDLERVDWREHYVPVKV